MQTESMYSKYMSLKTVLKKDFNKSKLPEGTSEIPSKRGKPLGKLGYIGKGWNERHDQLWELLKGGKRFSIHSLQRYQNENYAASINCRLVHICRSKNMRLEAVAVFKPKGRNAGRPATVFKLVRA